MCLVLDESSFVYHSLVCSPKLSPGSPHHSPLAQSWRGPSLQVHPKARSSSNPRVQTPKAHLANLGVASRGRQILKQIRKRMTAPAQGKLLERSRQRISLVLLTPLRS